jgi:probable F420-dependent oxidoreductase
LETTVKFSLGLPIDHVEHGAEFVGPDAVREMSQAAEALGFDALNLTDHPAPTVNWLRHAGHHAQDPFVLLAMVAAHTKRIGLHTYLLVLPYRNPFLTARAISSLDAFSGGRVIISAGVGYLKGEFKSLGVDFDSRQELFEESIAAMKSAWTNEEFSFQGRFYQARDTSILPLPAQKPHPPIWIGGNSKAAIRRAVDMADGWSPMFGGGPALAQTARTADISTVEEFAERVAYMRDYAAERGRSRPLDLCVAPPASRLQRGASSEQLVDSICQVAELGANWCTVSGAGATRAEWLHSIERLAKEVVEKVKARG